MPTQKKRLYAVINARSEEKGRVTRDESGNWWMERKNGIVSSDHFRSKEEVIFKVGRMLGEDITLQKIEER